MCDEREPCGQRGAQAAQFSTRKIEMLYQLKHSLASTTTLPAGLRCNRRAAQAPTSTHSNWPGGLYGCVYFRTQPSTCDYEAMAFDGVVQAWASSR